MGKKWSLGNIVKEFAKGTTVTGFHSEEMGEVRGARKRDLDRQFKSKGSYDEAKVIKSKGFKERKRRGK